MQQLLQSTLLFLAATYPLISYFKPSKLNAKSTYSLVALVVVLGAIKTGVDVVQMPENYYALLESQRHFSGFSIRQNYKSLSKKHHPDKNLNDANASDMFNRVKAAYDVLNDEEHRDVYNRFGAEFVLSDPRRDELRLLSTVASYYLGWGVLSYIFTLPIGARVARTWVTLVLIAMLIAHVSLTLTESQLPTWIYPKALTEYECIIFLHSFFPIALALLRTLSEYLYLDVDDICVQCYSKLVEQNENVYCLMEQLKQTIVGSKKDIPFDSIQKQLVDIQTSMSNKDDEVKELITQLKQSSSNPGSSYYWIIFIFLYAGVYLFQS